MWWCYREIDDNYDRYIEDEGGKLTAQGPSPKVTDWAPCGVCMTLCCVAVLWSKEASVVLSMELCV